MNPLESPVVMIPLTGLVVRNYQGVAELSRGGERRAISIAAPGADGLEPSNGLPSPATKFWEGTK
jgi:hypothetical protein